MPAKKRFFDGSNFWPDSNLETDEELPYGSLSSAAVYKIHWP